MIGKTRKSSLTILILLAALPIFLPAFSAPASALTEVEVNPVNSPAGAVVLIADGMSAPFIYPELTPYAIDGNPLEKALLKTIPEIGEDSARVLEFRAPQTFTEGGHSVLVTGNSKADSEMASFRDATVFDVLHGEGYLCIAVMEKGDSWSICSEQDAILRDKNNSMKDLQIVLEQYDHSPEAPRVPPGLIALMEEEAGKAPGYVSSKETRERYSGYNRWGLDAACAIVEYMAENRQGQKYLLTVNVGAVDMSGHYRGSYGYIDCIESLDAELAPLYGLCRENNIAFILTADHGMGFSSEGSKGGHQSEKYSVTDEARMVPLIVHARDVERGVLRGEFGQEDFAPTLLGVLDVPERPRFADGEQILLTGHVNLKVELPGEGTAELLKDGKLIASAGNDNEFVFFGLEPESAYTVRAALENGDRLEGKEKEVFLGTDSVIEFNKKGLDMQETVPGNGQEDKTGSQSGPGGESTGFFGIDPKQLIGYLFIGLINLAGLVIIAKVLKKQ
ncbi:phosphoglycerate mutase [Methanosarcina sp. KYL-1]|uniref:alkaline phosphatase family protein n=1 Tax=Methanosarcina sp. KYL-1 TaxID=2602068 RepID=UPI0021018AD9|nr:alkaline phosphatase family protein [Methanosarcina sp. KYL-1]MCQ1535657.1 phosphoglycerate mutase [Methanosarcina sp. KYL-1]